MKNLLFAMALTVSFAHRADSACLSDNFTLSDTSHHTIDNQRLVFLIDVTSKLNEPITGIFLIGSLHLPDRPYRIATFSWFESSISGGLLFGETVTIGVTIHPDLRALRLLEGRLSDLEIEVNLHNVADLERRPAYLDEYVAPGWKTDRASSICLPQ